MIANTDTGIAVSISDLTNGEVSDIEKIILSTAETNGTADLFISNGRHSTNGLDMIYKIFSQATYNGYISFVTFATA